MKTEKELYKLWKEYIDIPIYRVVSGWHFNDILKNGINPKKDPYNKIKPKLFEFYELVLELEEKRGYTMHFDFGDKGYIGSYWAKVSLSDLKKPVVDFTPNDNHINYYLALKGGALVANVERLTSKIRDDKPSLSKSEWKLINWLFNWSQEMKIQNRAIVVKGSCKFFEKALYQLTGTTKTKVRRNHREFYHVSPFGSFEHFKKVIKNEGLRKYIFRLKQKKYFLRVKSFIPAKDIKQYIPK